MTSNNADEKIKQALDVIFRLGQVDGGHHKEWVIDQITRALKGDEYDEFVKDYCDGEYGPQTYEWSEGVAP